MARVQVRFADDGVLEGEAAGIDLDRTDFELSFAGADARNRSQRIPLPSVKCVTLARRPVEDGGALDALQKVAVRFRDGEEIRGVLHEVPRRARYGVTVELVRRDGDEVEVLGIPYDNLVAMFFLRDWDGEDEGAPLRGSAPLPALLSELRSLSEAREAGLLSDEQFDRNRQAALDRF